MCNAKQFFIMGKKLKNDEHFLQKVNVEIEKSITNFEGSKKQCAIYYNSDNSSCIRIEIIALNIFSNVYSSHQMESFLKSFDLQIMYI